MKRAKLLTGALAAVTILAFSSCKKDNASNVNGVSAKLGSNSWNSSVVIGAYSNNYLELEAYSIRSGDTSNISINFDDGIEIGKPDAFDHSMVYYSTSKAIYTGSSNITYGHGTLTVTSWDKTAKKVAGNFNGVLYNVNDGKDSLVVTNGAFNTQYQEN